MIIVKGQLIPITIKQILHDLREETGLFREINDIGENFMITCPVHSGGMENNPSCGVLKRDKEGAEGRINAGKVHCYTCGYKATIDELVADVLNLGEARNGLNWLISRYVADTPVRGGRRKIDLNLERKVEEPTPSIPTKKVRVYNQLFNSYKDAIDYMEGRGISLETCNKYSVGYNPSNDSLVFPVLGRDGEYKMLKERSLKGKRFFNQKGISKAGLVYGLHELEGVNSETPIWICESEIDVLTLDTYGHKGVTIMGSHLSSRQERELINSPIRRLIDGLDRDPAGRKGFQDIRARLIPKGFRLYEVIWNSTGKDINDLTVEEFKGLKFKKSFL